MSEKKRFELLDETIFDNQKQAEDGGRVTYWIVEYQQRQELVELLNILSEEVQLLKCALALNAVTNISLNDKKIDIPPYYEFENYQQLKTERREEYDEYW